MRILLAEPSKIGRTIVSRQLEAGGHHLIFCDCAEEALQILESDEDIDVLITAIEFIGMSGLELCWNARLVASINRPLYVLVMSASSDEMKVAEALDSGADDFISKPPRSTELLARLRSAERIAESKRKLIQIASVDALTGLKNRRIFFDLIAEAEHQPGPWAVIMLDIDYFKQVNDLQGHDGGDIVLKEVARRLKRVNPQFARIGGEEFALLVRSELEEAGKLAERIRLEICMLPVELPNTLLNVSVSLGVAQRQVGETFEKTLKDADIALYASKSGGRNRVTTARFGRQPAEAKAPVEMQLTDEAAA
ncbi:PleD Response regulator containing a CheY-like receiver domain and a GGDEF domain [Rhabdaerophilaceae bacterium]